MAESLWEGQMGAFGNETQEVEDTLGTLWGYCEWGSGG